MKRPALFFLALSLALAFVASACSSGSSNAKGSSTTTTVKARDAGEAIAYDPRLSTFATALNASGVLGELSGSQRVTVFAPDNAAFARIPHAALVSLLTRRSELAKFVRAHVVKGAIPESALHGRLKTLAGSTLTVRKSAQGTTVSDVHGHTATVELPPIQAHNAVIYPVDAVLSAPTAR